MTDQSRLEHRYRRWLALYPPPFRSQHEEEMVAVLMQASAPDQSRPTVSEVADILAHGLRRRAGSRFPSDWERAHSALMFPLRLLIAAWLCFISAMLIGFDRGQPWLALLIPAIALHIYIAYRIRPSAPGRPHHPHTTAAHQPHAPDRDQ